MDESKTDRRIKYTKHSLKNSLIELLKEQPISKVSVSLLCKTADVNRTTFYSHYTDQFDMLNQVEQEVLKNMENYITEPNKNQQSVLDMRRIERLIEYAGKNTDLFQVLLGENGNRNFQQNVIELVSNPTISDKNKARNTDVRLFEYLRRFSVTGCISIIQKWLEDGQIESPQYISNIILHILQHGVESF